MEVNISREVQSTFWRWAVGLALVLVLTVASGWVMRDTYTKAETDTRIESKIAPLQQKVDYMRDDVQWLVRDRGGVPAEEQEKEGQ